MPFHSNDLGESASGPAEIAFLRSQLDRTARESALRLELVSSECESRIEQLSRQHDADIRMLHLEHDTKMVLVKREGEGKVEALQCALESLRCRYVANVDRMRIESDEKVQRLEAEKDALAVAQLEAQDECKRMDVELTKVHAERVEGITVIQSKDVELEELLYVLRTSFISTVCS